MQKTIHKQHLLIAGSQTLTMPKGAEILHVGMRDGDQITIWYIHEDYDPTALGEVRTFAVFGTSEYFEGDDLTHLGTVFQGLYVWHVFEVI